MGTRFTRCLGLSKYSAVLDSSESNNTYQPNGRVLMAIAMELDECESNIPGLILGKDNEV